MKDQDDIVNNKMERLEGLVTLTSSGREQYTRVIAMRTHKLCHVLYHSQDRNLSFETETDLKVKIGEL